MELVNYSPILVQTLWNCIVARTFVNDTLESNDGEQTTGDRRARNKSENNYSQQAAGVATCGLLEELIALCSSHCGNVV